MHTHMRTCTCEPFLVYVHVFTYAYLYTEAMLILSKYTRAHLFRPVLHDAVLQRVIELNVSL